MHRAVPFRPFGRIVASLVLLCSAAFGLSALVNASSAEESTGTSLVTPALAAARDAHPSPDGEKVYLMRCMSCHQMNGLGVAGVFPPLDGSDWVTGDKGRLVRVILHGVTGAIEVDGVTYNGAMPPWGSFLKDDEVAALSTYIRNSWSNKAEALTEADVAAVRKATAERKKPYTAEELAQKGNQGIPGGK